MITKTSKKENRFSKHKDMKIILENPFSLLRINIKTEQTIKPFTIRIGIAGENFPTQFNIFSLASSISYLGCCRHYTNLIWIVQKNGPIDTSGE